MNNKDAALTSQQDHLLSGPNGTQCLYLVPHHPGGVPKIDQTKTEYKQTK